MSCANDFTALFRWFVCCVLVSRGLFPFVRRVGVKVAAEVAREQQGLRVQEQADGEFFPEKGVLDFFLFSFLPGGEDFLASVVGEEHGAVFNCAKMFRLDLLAVHQGERKAVGEGDAKFFHEVEREAFASGAVAVEEADGGVESVRGEGAGGVEAQECVEVGEEGVEGVAGRAAVAFAEGEVFALLWRDHLAEDGEVLGGGFAFNAAEGVEVVGCGEGAEAVRDGVGGGFEGAGGSGVVGGVFAGGAAIQWLRDGLRLFDESRDAEYLAGKTDSSEGVYFVPAFTGLGAPHWDMYARGCIVGITRGTKREHIIRAAEEAIAYQSLDVIRAMEKDTGSRITEIKADGGASRDSLLMQFQADISDKSLLRPAIRETTALGAAYLAGLALGIWKNTDELKRLWKCDTIFTPRMDQKQRQALLAGWNKAVGRSLDWAEN